MIPVHRVAQQIMASPIVTSKKRPLSSLRFHCDSCFQRLAEKSCFTFKLGHDAKQMPTEDKENTENRVAVFG